MANKTIPMELNDNVVDIQAGAALRFLKQVENGTARFDAEALWCMSRMRALRDALADEPDTYDAISAEAHRRLKRGDEYKLWPSLRMLEKVAHEHFAKRNAAKSRP